GLRDADLPAARAMSRPRVITTLERNGLLPAITFIFSRAGCEQAVTQCLLAGIQLTTPQERREIRRIVDERTAQIPEADLEALGWRTWRTALTRGLAAHHAGLLPTFMEVVEELFTRGLVKAVFATETLALGINMPARTVVLEKLVKFNGEGLVPVTPGEYTQLTGRAGRRGIDVEGHAVVLWRPGLDPHEVAGLASRRTYPLKSSFRPTPNMAVNLVDRVGRDAAHTVLESSFAQFQTDRAVVGMARQVREMEQALAGYAEAMHCDRGDFASYAQLREQLSRAEKEAAKASAANRRTEVAESLRGLRVGDVVDVPSGRRAGVAVVIDPGRDAGLDGPRPVLLTLDRQVRTLSPGDVRDPVRTLDRVRVPAGFNPRNARAKRDLASTVRNVLAEGARGRGDESTADGDQPATSSVSRAHPRSHVGRSERAARTRVDRLRAELLEHPCHQCPEREQHARWANRHRRLEAQLRTLLRRVEGRTNTLAKTFDRLCDLLVELGYLEPDSEVPGGLRVTRQGRRLRRIYTDKDLLVAQCLRAGTWSRLDEAGLAAMAANIVYESRRGTDTGQAPAGPVGAAILETEVIWADLAQLQERYRLEPMDRPDAGLTAGMLEWARGAPLEAVFDEADIPPGDFVRWARQVVDLLGQIAQAYQDEPGGRGEGGHAKAIAQRARAATDAVDRGVVALGGGRG
ncbi:MAG: DEAD/DEAH box helicase, partial [Actinomycetales bacterium]